MALLYLGFAAQVLTMSGIVIVSLRTPPPPVKAKALTWNPALLLQYGCWCTAVLVQDLAPLVRRLRGHLVLPVLAVLVGLVSHSSTAALAQGGIGTVRMRFPFPARSTMHQRPVALLNIFNAHPGEFLPGTDTNTVYDDAHGTGGKSVPPVPRPRLKDSYPNRC